MKNKILVIDDNNHVRSLIEAILKNDYEIKLANSAEEGLDILNSYIPHLILLDIMLPEMNGFEVCSQIKSRPKLGHIPIVIISAKTGTVSRTMGYQLGALNYIEKPFESAELLAVVKSTLNKKNQQQKDILSFGNLQLNTVQQNLSVKNQTVHLTPKEFRLLSTLLKRPCEVISRQEILEVIDPDNLEVSDRIIDTHISSIRKKIKTGNLKISAIYGEGYTIKLSSEIKSGY